MKVSLSVEELADVMTELGWHWTDWHAAVDWSEEGIPVVAVTDDQFAMMGVAGIYDRRRNLHFDPVFALGQHAATDADFIPLHVEFNRSTGYTFWRLPSFDDLQAVATVDGWTAWCERHPEYAGFRNYLGEPCDPDGDPLPTKEVSL